jgi:hypothetical protein
MLSEEYKKQLKQLHLDKSRPRGFGGKIKDLGEFYTFMNKWQPSTLLDYGCGKGIILAHLKEKYPQTTIFGYDPAVNLYEKNSNIKVECLFSNDVLEHIEPNYINDVLTHINLLAEKFIWLRIDTLPARKKLPDGRNAHLILENKDWWENRIHKFITGKIVYSALTKKGKLDIAIEKNDKFDTR